MILHAASVAAPAVRRQLTLFVSGELARRIEAVRERVDPVQQQLIPAHVTLCREDEIIGLGVHDILTRLESPSPATLRLQFGPPQSFFGHGMLMSCTAGQPAFRALRERILDSTAIRDHPAHLTLAHPRNPKAPGNALSAAAGLARLPPIEFSEVHLIEQVGAAPWRVLDAFRIGSGNPAPVA